MNPPTWASDAAADTILVDSRTATAGMDIEHNLSCVDPIVRMEPLFDLHPVLDEELLQLIKQEPEDDPSSSASMGKRQASALPEGDRPPRRRRLLAMTASASSRWAAYQASVKASLPHWEELDEKQRLRLQAAASSQQRSC